MQSLTPQNFIDALPHIALLVSLDGTVLFVNERWHAFGQENGLSPTYESCGKNYLDLCDDNVGTALRAVLAGEVPQAELLYPCHSPDKERWFRVHMSTVADASMVLLVHVNVTAEEVRDLEQKNLLMFSEEKFRQVFEQAPMGISITSLDGIFIDTNATFARMLGYSKQEVLGLDFKDLTHPDDLARNLELFKKLLRGEFASFQIEKRYSGRHGVVWASVTVALLCAPDGTPHQVVALAEDITEHLQAIEKLKRSEDRFRLFSSASSDAIWDWNASTDLMWWNEEFERKFGFLPGENPARYTSKHWLKRIHLEDRGRIRKLIGRLTTSDHSRWRVEYRCLKRDGQYASVVDHALVIRDEAGKIERVVGGITDLTKQKELEEQLCRAQRMESVGKLAGGIAHDLNNVFTPIVFSVQLLREIETLDELGRFVDVIESCAHRGSGLIAQLLAYARGTPKVKVPVNLDEIVRDVEKVVLETFPKSLKINFISDEGLWEVEGDPSQLHQVLLNLTVNARDAMPEGGTITVSLENVELDTFGAQFSPSIHAGRYVKLSVQDTGTGIRPEVLPRIFEPFFTTKAQGKGTGLGLATTHSIVKSHGGGITATSDVGKGTVFCVHLPANEGAPLSDAVIVKEDMLQGQGQQILVVDDELEIRQLLEHTLSRHGYRVVVASNGAEAVRTFAELNGSVDLVLTDMAMPVMDGPATIKALRAIAPELPIIGSSGFADAHSSFVDLGLTGLIHKPYARTDLLKVIAAGLGSAVA